MLEALARSGVDADVLILSRDPAGFAARAPHLARRFAFVAGDVSEFAPPPGRFTHVIHAAPDASAALNANDPPPMSDTIVSGTRRILDLAVERDAVRVLFLSFGAVYDAPQIGRSSWRNRGWPSV